MALFGVGNNKIKVRVVRHLDMFEVCVKDLKITREINSASKLTCSILRDTITPEVGDIIAFTLDEQHNQFYGYIVTTNKHLEWCDVEAFDQLYYMNRNKSRMNYENITASKLLERIAKDRGYGILDPPQFEDTGYLIPARIEENVTDLTIITTALDLTYENTGNRFYIWDDYGSLSLTSESWMAGEPTTIVEMGYLEDYNYNETMEGAYTTARIEKSNNTPGDDYGVQTERFEVLTAVNQYGRLEYFDTAEDNENPWEKAVKALDDKLPPVRKLSLSGVQGDITVRGGTPILVDFFTHDRKELIRGWFRCTSVTHNFESNFHSMDLECELIYMYDEWDNNNLDYYHAYDNYKLQYPADYIPPKREEFDFA